MLDVAVSFLADEFNAYLLRRTGSTTIGKMAAGPVMNDLGKLAIPVGSIGACLINVEESASSAPSCPSACWSRAARSPCSPNCGST